MQCTVMITDDTDNDFITKLLALAHFGIEFFFLSVCEHNLNFDHNIYNFDIQQQNTKSKRWLNVTEKIV